MQAPNFPPDEAERHEALCELMLLDTQPEERFDRITRSARRMFGVQTALITLVDSERQWFKSRQGLDAPETPRRVSFCGHAILGDQPFVVYDAAEDARFADNPLVTGAPHIRFYAGMPLRGPRGHKIGTLCLLDPAPRRFTAEDVQALHDLGAWAEAELNSVAYNEATRVARANSRQIRQQMGMLETISESTGAIVFVRDLEGRFLYANKPYAHLLHQDGKDLIGRHMREFFSPDMWEQFHQRDLAVARSGVPQREENLLDAGSGINPHLVVRSPLRNERGEVYAVCGVGTDLTETRLVERAMQDLNRKLRDTSEFQHAILNSANFSIICTDVDGVIKLFNVGAERMLGYSAEDVVERKTLALLHDLNEVVARAKVLSVELGMPVEPNFEALAAKARHSVADEYEWTYTRRDGTRFPVMLSMTALRNEGREISGFLAIAYDITERKQVESMKSEFISTVSHELRTPLTSIRGALGLLAAGTVGKIPDRAQGLLEIAKSNCERLVRLINDILDIEKIEAGSMRFELRTQKLRPLVEQAMEATRHFAEQYQVRFEFTADSADALVNIDTDRVTQVVVNLLSNAAKFSPPGAAVYVRILPSAGSVKLSVRDRGPGIPLEFRHRIFQKFAQADSSDTRQKGGTGLGLAICKVIIEKHHGVIDFTTQQRVDGKDGGSEFFFVLPVAPLQSQVLPIAGRVLICEDEPVVAQTLGLMMREVGLSSDVADSGAAARRLLAERDYDAMTLDLVLPDEDGLSLLKWLRSEPRTRRLPVVVVSASDAEMRDQLQDAAVGAIGVVDWIEKPVDPVRLLAALENGARRVEGTTPSVLYVEDDADLARVIATTLEPSFTVTNAASVAAAKGALERFHFDLILLDLQLPDGNGATLLATMPELNAATPVVIFSAQESARFTIETVQAQLVKSRTSGEDLLSTLRSLIGRAHTEQRSEAAARDPAIPGHVPSDTFSKDSP